MVEFEKWCDFAHHSIGKHTLRIMTGRDADRSVGVVKSATVVSTHYVSEENVTQVLERLGKPGVANLIREKLPTTKEVRSGDIGEIYATEWIDALSGCYCVAIKRHRWKDHNNMAMKGEDAIGLFLDPKTQHLHFLKTEAKSVKNLSARTLKNARNSLDKNDGLPTPHTLAFISSRLRDLGKLTLANLIDDVALKYGIPLPNVQHLLFVFSGSDPEALMTTSLKEYSGPVQQVGVGLHVKRHSDFIAAVFDRVIADAKHP